MTALRTYIEQQLTRAKPSFWYKLITSPLAKIYGLRVTRRNRGFDSGARKIARLPGRVISIGNLAIGGTGKSPITLALAVRIIQQGGRPAILSRGYGSGLRANEALILRGGKIIWQSHKRKLSPPDEGLMQSVALPDTVCVFGANRHRAAQACLDILPRDTHPTHWLLDDGFQHRQIARDVDIVLVDAQSPLGSSRLLPAGNLREFPQALARASLVIATRAKKDIDIEGLKAKLRSYYSGPILPAAFVTSLPSYDQIKHAPVLVVAGIANPQLFLHTIEDLGVVVGGCLFFADHGRIDPAALQKALRSCRSVITTAKDYWRDPAVFANCGSPVLIAELTPDIDLSLVDHLLFKA